jgi:hypothetical protein
VIYLDKHLVLYSPLNIEYNREAVLSEGKTIIEKYGAWISSKGTELKRPDLTHVSIDEADTIERKSREQQRDDRPEDFPVRGVLLRGINGLKYSFSYLITDTSKFEWTRAAYECPYIVTLLNDLPFERLGRVNIQTVEAGMSLHKHIDSVYRMDSETVNRRNKHLSQYNIKDFNMDIDCILTIVLQGNGINFHYTRSNETVTMYDHAYYFRPDLIHHSVDKSEQQRIICRIEGKASTEMIDMIQEHAKANSDRVLVI